MSLSHAKDDWPIQRDWAELSLKSFPQQDPTPCSCRGWGGRGSPPCITKLLVGLWKMVPLS
jgi:hypothetical protein